MLENKERGSVATVTIIITAILLILGAGAIKIAITNLNTDMNYRDGIAAQYLAEAGAQRMYIALMSDPNNPIATVTVAKNIGTATAGTYEANVTVNPSDANQLIIYSKGTVNGAVRVIRMIMQKGTAPVGGGYSSTNGTSPPGPGEGSISIPISVDVGIFSGNTLTINNNAVINCDTYSNASTVFHNNTEVGDVSAVGSVTVNNNSQLGNIYSNGTVVINGNTNTGDIYSNSSVTVNNNGAVTGDITAANTITVWGATTGTRTPNTPQTPLQPISYAPPSSTNANEALNRNTYSSGIAPPTGSATLNGGNYYISGNYVINNNVTIEGDGIVYIAGNVTFNKKVTFTGNVTLLIEGNATFKNNTVFNNGLILSGGTVTFNNDLTMNGAILASSDVTFNNNLELTYSPRVGTTVLSYTNQ